MVIRQSIYALASLSLVVAGAACSNNRAEERSTPATTAGTPVAGGRDMVKVEGCLSGGSDGRFVVTAAPDALANTVARAGAGDRDTHSYVLVGGDNLQAHTGKRVEVSGQFVGKKQEVEQEAGRETQAAPASGESKTPTVKTTEAVDIEVRQLQVATVRELAPTCQVTP